MTTKYILKVIEKAQVEDIKKISLKKRSAEDFTKHANLWLSTTVWSGPCTSWYKSGTDTKSAPMFPGTRTLFLKTLEADPRFEHYDIEYLSGNSWNFLGNGMDVIELNGVSYSSSFIYSPYKMCYSLMLMYLTERLDLVLGIDEWRRQGGCAIRLGRVPEAG